MILCTMANTAADKLPGVVIYVGDDDDFRSEEYDALFGDGKFELKVLTVCRDVWTCIFTHCDILTMARTISTCKGLWLRYKDSPLVEKWKFYLTKGPVSLGGSTLFLRMPDSLQDFVLTANTLPERVEKNISDAAGKNRRGKMERRDPIIRTFMTEAERILRKAVGERGLIEAARSGEESIVKIYLTRRVFTPWAIYSASRFGHQSIVSTLLYWLAREDPRQPPEIRGLAVFGAMVRDWIAGKDISASVPEHLPFYGFAGLAAENGEFEALEFILYFQKAKMDNHLKIYGSAAKGGRIDVIEWLQKNVNNPYVDNIGQSAAAAGQIHVIDWVMKSRYKTFIVGDKLMHAAATNGCSPSLIFVMEFYWEFYRVSEESAGQAAINGHLEFLQCAQWYSDLNVGRCRKLAARHHHDNVVKGLN